MKEMDMTEQAYRNGYAAGVEDSKPKWFPSAQPPEVKRRGKNPRLSLVSDPVITYNPCCVPRFIVSVYVVAADDNSDSGVWYTGDMAEINPEWWTAIPEPSEEATHG